FIVPTFGMLVISFRPASLYGGVSAGWTLEAWRSLGNPSYPLILWRTVWLSLLTTAICLALALPVAFVLGRLQGKWRAILLMLVIVPFWTNFVIRVAAWRIMLHPEGMLRHTLLSLGLIGPDTLL